MTRRLRRLPWFVSPPRIVPYLPSPRLHLLPPFPPPYVVPVWPANVSGLTNALTARLTLIYFFRNLGAGGNNAEWHYLFIKSKASVSWQDVMTWYQHPHSAQSPYLNPPPPPSHPHPQNQKDMWKGLTSSGQNCLNRVITIHFNNNSIHIMNFGWWYDS